MKQSGWLPVALLAGCVSAPMPSPIPPPPQALGPPPGAQDATFARDAALDQAATAIPHASAISQHSIGLPSGPITVSNLSLPDTVFFDFGVARPRSDAAPSLDVLARAVQSSPPDSVLTIAGNTDAIGSARSNQGLSEARAQAVVAALVGLGIPPGRLAAIGFGATRPIASNDTDAGRALNRRVELALSTSFAANEASFTAVVPIAPVQPVAVHRQSIRARTPAPQNVHLNRLDPISRNTLGPPVSY